MPISFPTSPSNGDTHVIGSITYQYDSTDDKWTGLGVTPADRLVEGSNSLEIDANNFVWKIGGSEASRIDSSGRLLVGTSSAVSTTALGAARAQIVGTDNVTSQLSISRFSDDADRPRLVFIKSRSGTIGTNTTVQDDDAIGRIEFLGAGGSATNDYPLASHIGCFVDGTPGANDMPGRLVFSTTADGYSSPTERMRISQDGSVDIGPNNGTQPTSSVRGFRVRSDAHTLISRGVNDTGVVVHVYGASGEARIKGDGDLENTNNSYGALSDIKLKENVIDASSQWDDLKALQVRKYNFKAESGYSTHTQLGLIAQEVELVSPGLVGESIDEETGESTKSVNYSVLYMKAVKALQEAMERIETLEASNADLLARVAALEAN